MKIWILIFSAALFVGGTCLGVALQPKLVPPQPVIPIASPTPPPPMERHHHEFSVHRFASDLELSAEQDRALDDILSDSQDEMKALGRAMRAAQDKSRERILQLLTPEQKSKLESLMSAERQKRGDAELDRTTATYKTILKLSDEQAVKFRAALVEGRSKRREGYKPGGDWRESRKAGRDVQNKAIKGALTDDQWTRYLEVSELERYER